MFLLNKLFLILLVIDSLLLLTFIVMYKTTDQDMLVSKSSGAPNMRGGSASKDFATTATKYLSILFMVFVIGLGVTTTRIAKSYKIEANIVNVEESTSKVPF